MAQPTIPPVVPTSGPKSMADLATQDINPGFEALSPVIAAAAPMAADDASGSKRNYPGKFWVRTDTGRVFVCRAVDSGAAVWLPLDFADFFGYVANNWYLPYGVAAYAAGAATAAGRIFLHPWINKQRVTLSALGLRVTTAASGGNAQIGLYAADAVTRRPTGTALCATPSMSTAAATSVSGAVNCQLEPGLYWYGVNSDNATAAYVCVTSTSPLTQQLIGSATEANVPGAANIGLQFQVLQTFGAWPDMTGVALIEQISSGNQVPLMHFKVASIP